MKAIFIPLIVANREHLERSCSKRRFAQFELPAERSAMLPDFSLVLSHPAETTRGIVELGLLLSEALCDISRMTWSRKPIQRYSEADVT